VDVRWLALVWQQLAAAGQLPATLPEPSAGAEVLPRGISYASLGKTDLFSAVGSRNVVQQELFDVLTRAASRVSEEDVYGPHQGEALKQALLTSDARWKVMASSVSFTSMVLDLRQDPAKVSPEVAPFLAGLQQAASTDPVLAFFVNRFLLTVDQWDGLPNKRRQVLDFLRRHVPGAVCISGDIHGTFVTDHGNGEGALVEFTGPAISSKTFRGETANVVEGLPLPNDPQVQAAVAGLVQGLDLLIDPEIRPGPLDDRVDQRIAYANTGANGLYVMEAGPARLRVRYHLLPPEVVTEPYAADPGDTLARFSEREFDVSPDGALQEVRSGS
jgi:alkaline phosphatase D